MNTTIKNHRTTPQVKICGITRVEDGLEIAELGVDALGFVFFPKSPRNVSDETAKDIIRQLPAAVDKVGVFVNASFSEIMKKVETCGLTGVQLHGKEAPDLVTRLVSKKILVVKALFSGKEPSMTEVLTYTASAYLVECGKGVLPGGNALTWNWSKARDLSRRHPLILAGGLTPENVGRAISDAAPHAVDVSSGVEMEPGIKDAGKVKAFLEAVKESYINQAKKIFFLSTPQ
jgi:phosphoribosylanthranilate isomerase